MHKLFALIRKLKIIFPISYNVIIQNGYFYQQTESYFFDFLNLKIVVECNHIVHWALTKPIRLCFYIFNGLQAERMASGVACLQEQGVIPKRKGLLKWTDNAKTGLLKDNKT